MVRSEFWGLTLRKTRLPRGRDGGAVELQRTGPGSGEDMPELEWLVSELRIRGFTFAYSSCISGLFKGCLR